MRPRLARLMLGLRDLLSAPVEGDPPEAAVVQWPPQFPVLRLFGPAGGGLEYRCRFDGGPWTDWLEVVGEQAFAAELVELQVRKTPAVPLSSD